MQKNCLHVLAGMKQSAHTYLLKPVHEGLKVSLFTTDSKVLFILITNVIIVLKRSPGESCKYRFSPTVHGSVTCLMSRLFLTQPQYRQLGTSDWLNKSLFDKLLLSIERELQDLQGSVEPCHQVDTQHKTHSSF